MELTNQIIQDITSKSISGYEWEKEILSHTKPLQSLNEILDSNAFQAIADTWENTLPVIVTFLSKEYLKVGEIWISKIKQTSVKQYLIIATDEETKIFLDSIDQPNCRVWLDEKINLTIDYRSKTGFTEKGLSVTSLKFPIVKEILQRGFDTFLVDIDALLLSNLPLRFFSSFDIAFQRVIYFPDPIASVWNFAACSGFVWFKSNPNTIDLIDNTIQNQLKVYSDQIALNIALWERNIRWNYQPTENSDKSERERFFVQYHNCSIEGISQKSELKICALPTDLYWRNDFAPFEISKVIVFHPNSPKIQDEKLIVFKKHGAVNCQTLKLTLDEN